MLLSLLCNFRLSDLFLFLLLIFCQLPRNPIRVVANSFLINFWLPCKFNFQGLYSFLATSSYLSESVLFHSRIHL